MKRMMAILTVTLLMVAVYYFHLSPKIVSEDWIEPVCTEVANGEILIGENKIYDPMGKKEININNMTLWVPYDKHSILVVENGWSVLKVDTELMEMKKLFDSYECYSPIKSMITNGSIIYFSTKTDVYMFSTEDGSLKHIANDDMISHLLCPISTTDICWESYNPYWLKRYYEEKGNDENIYNQNRSFTMFFDITSWKQYRWERTNVLDSYLIQGAEWYKNQKQG